MSGRKKKQEEPVQAMDELIYWLWLARALGPGHPRAGRIIEKYEDAKEAWIVRKTDGFRELAGEAAFARASQPENAPQTFLAFARECAEKHIQILPYGDPDYPKALCSIPDRPLVLYCTGNPQWLNEGPKVGIVGSRKPSEYGRKAARDIGGKLAACGAVIVSGLADGLDSVAHTAAVENSKPTIAVLGVSIDRTYPASKRELRRKIEACGCVISEYPPKGCYMGANGFLQRNRLIAALSKAVLVVEAKEESGTMYTAAYAKQYDRQVYAVPGDIYSPYSTGTNALLRDKQVKVACRASDLYEVLGIHEQSTEPADSKAPKTPLNETEKKVMEHIGYQPVSVEELRVGTGLPMPVLVCTLMKLVLYERIIQQPGQRYVLR